MEDIVEPLAPVTQLMHTEMPPDWGGARACIMDCGTYQRTLLAIQPGLTREQRREAVHRALARVGR